MVVTVWNEVASLNALAAWRRFDVVTKAEPTPFITPHARRPLSKALGMNGASELQVGVLFACLPFQFPAHLLE